MDDQAMTAAVGAEMRLAREAAGFSRRTLVAALPFQVAAATILNWEHGHRAISFGRLVSFGLAVGVPAPDLLRRAVERAQAAQAAPSDGPADTREQLTQAATQLEQVARLLRQLDIRTRENE